MSQQICSQIVSFFRNLFSGGQAQSGQTPAAPAEAPPAIPGETGVARYVAALAVSDPLAEALSRVLPSLEEHGLVSGGQEAQSGETAAATAEESVPEEAPVMSGIPGETGVTRYLASLAESEPPAAPEAGDQQDPHS